MGRTKKVKGTRSAYNWFVKDQYARIHTRHKKQLTQWEQSNQRTPKPTLPNFSEVSSQLSERWRKLPPNERKPYEEKSTLDKLRYQREKKDYIQRLTNPKRRRKRKRAVFKEPKKPLTAYNCFDKEVRQLIKRENPDLTFGELSREIGRRWREMTMDDKVPYQQKSQEDKERYQKELEMFQSRLTESEMETETETEMGSDSELSLN